MSSPHSERFNLENFDLKRDRLCWGEKLARFTWLKVGGPAEVFFRPNNESELISFIRILPVNASQRVLGNASNLLVRDGGVPGAVIKLGSGFTYIKIKENYVTVGAGTASISIARKAQMAGLSGLEFMSGIPGTAAGILFMNAGAYGREVQDVFVSARAIDQLGKFHNINKNSISFGYRCTDINSKWVITEITFKGEFSSPATIESEMQKIQRKRQISQPINTLTGGSTFKNPEGKKAWELIENAKCRGLRHGEAMISCLHSNFMINRGTATARDFESLGEEVRRRVYLASGIKLEWEIERIGVELGEIKLGAQQ